MFFTVSEQYFITIFLGIILIKSIYRTYIAFIILKIIVFRIVYNPRYKNRPIQLYISISVIYFHWLPYAKRILKLY